MLKTETRICEICGAEFYANYRQKKKKTCSPACAIKLMKRTAKKREASGEGRKPRSMTSLVCGNCGKQFERYTNQVKGKTQFFCCCTCAIAYRNKVAKQKEPDAECLVCGDPFVKRTPTQRYCSHFCSNRRKYTRQLEKRGDNAALAKRAAVSARKTRDAFKKSVAELGRMLPPDAQASSIDPFAAMEAANQ